MECWAMVKPITERRSRTSEKGNVVQWEKLFGYQAILMHIASKLESWIPSYINEYSYWLQITVKQSRHFEVNTYVQ